MLNDIDNLAIAYITKNGFSLFDLVINDAPCDFGINLIKHPEDRPKYLILLKKRNKYENRLNTYRKFWKDNLNIKIQIHYDNKF